MKAYVTGATGCVGRNLADQLEADGWDTIVLHRQSSDLSKLAGCANVQFREVDLTDSRSVRSAMTESADAVFHVAANVSHWSTQAAQQWRDNVVATRNLVRAALERKVGRFVFTSTGAASRAGANTRIRSGYILSKKQSEIEVRDAIALGLDAVTLRLPIVIGKYDYHNYCRIFQELKTRRFRFCFPGILEFAHAADVAQGHLQAYQHAKTGECLYFGGERTSWYDVFVRITKLLGVGAPLKPFPVWVLYGMSYAMLGESYLTKREPAMTPELVYLINGRPEDPDLAGFERGRERAQAIGYQSAPLDDALRDCYQWLVQEGYI